MSRRRASAAPLLVFGAALALVFVPTRAAAEEGVRTMSLEEAKAFARSHHMRVVAARQRLLAAERDAEVPGSQWLPRVGATAQIVASTANNSTTTLLANPAVDLPRIGGTPMRTDPDMKPYPSTGAALGVRQELYDFGRISAERNAAALAGEVEKLRLATAALDVDYGVEQSYYGVLAAVGIAEASKAAFERATKHRDLARANVQSGMRPPIELTRADADVARYEAGTMRADAGIHVARSVFAAAAGVDDVELDAAPARDEARVIAPLSELLQSAATSPDVLVNRAQIEAQRAETKRLDAQTRPNIFATASISGRAGGAPPNAGPLPYGDGWLPTVPNYDVGVVLSWPLFEPSWSRRADASRAREAALASQADLSLRSLRSAISAAYHDADAALRTLGALERGSDAARANYDQADNRFRVGLGTSTELADAQAVRTEADIQLAIGRFQVARTRAALSRAVAEAKRR